MSEGKQRCCLECGTPKMPGIDGCMVCNGQTLTYKGVPRATQCSRCRHQNTGTQGGPRCNRYADTVPGKLACVAHLHVLRHTHDCEMFSRAYNLKGTDETTHPLDMQQRAWLRGFLETGAFWLDPECWDHVGDFATDAFWAKPKTRPGAKLGLGLLALGLVAAVVARKGVGNASSDPGLEPYPA